MFELLLLAIIVIPVAFYCSRLRRGWWFLDPINTFWPMYVLFGVVEPWASRDGWIGVYGESVVCWTLTLYILAGVTVYIGYVLPVGRRVARRLPLLHGFDHASRFVLVGFAALVVGGLAYAYVIRVSGGLEQFLSVSRTSINFEELSGYTLNLLTLVPLGLMILLCSTYHRPRYVILKRLTLVATAAFGIWCIYSGTRSGIIGVALIMLGSVYGAQRRNPPVYITALSFAAIVILVGFVAEYRGRMYGGQFHSDESRSVILHHSMEFYVPSEKTLRVVGSEFDMSLAVVSWVPDTVPYDYGYMMFEYFTMPVPRAWWPQKIYPGEESWDRFYRVAGNASWVNRAGHLGGPAPGLIGKYFFIAGPAGVLLGGLWTGVFLQLIRSYVCRYSGITGVLLAVGCFSLGYSEMNNPLWWPINWLPATGAGVLVAVLLGRRGAHTIGRARTFHRAVPIPVPACATQLREFSGGRGVPCQ
jgi:hypothetical protein